MTTPTRLLSRLTTCGLLGLVLGGAACSRPFEPARAEPAKAEPAARAATPASPADAARPPGPPPSGGPGQPEPPDEDGPITAADRAATINALTAALAQHYVFPDKAAALGKKLRERQQHGAYEGFARGAAFARALSEDMIGLVHDKHLEVRYFEHPVPPTEDDKPAEMDEEAAAEMRYNNHGVFEARRMKFNLGYLKFNAFGRPVKLAGDKLAAAMRLLTDTQSLIIDLRECHGGDTDTVLLAESYFLPANTHVLDMYVRSTNTTEPERAVAELAGPRYAATKPVFVLIGEETVSGCEAFAYALQSQKRATVIGGHSAGAAYFGGPRRLTDHFMAFVPVGRPIDPITHGDWESTGVTPTIAVAPEQALAAAERASLQLLEPQQHDKRRQAAMQKRLAELR